MSKKNEFLSLVMELMESDSSSSEEDDYGTVLALKLVNNPEDSDDDLFNHVREHRNRRNCIENYFEKVVPQYTDVEFKMHFRISKMLFDELSEKFITSEIYTTLRPDKRISGPKHIALFLWFVYQVHKRKTFKYMNDIKRFAGHEACSFRDLADRFNLSLWTVHTIIQRVIQFFSSMSPSVITWPTDVEKKESSKFFQIKSGFSRAIGCIDGTHIEIDPPARSKDDYIDRKGRTTLTMQAICNEKKKYIDIFVGYPGSSHDSWVFKNSPICERLPKACGENYILGDSAYPCSKYLITPYRDNGHLTKAQKEFNINLSSSRVAIEHTFGILKQRFRQLYYCKLKGIRNLCHFIRACCVLHNIANLDDIDFLLEKEPEEETSVLPISSNEIAPKGNAIRQLIYEEMKENHKK